VVKKRNGGELDGKWDDAYLLRFLRARKFNLKDTEKMWMDFIQWRQENHVDELQVRLRPVRTTTSLNWDNCGKSTPMATTSMTGR
jgi:hypothetical protein